MPIFDYKCPKCDRTFERITQSPDWDCTRHAPCVCGTQAVRQLSAPASIRMGTGTHRHDSGTNRTEV